MSYVSKKGAGATASIRVSSVKEMSNRDVASVREMSIRDMSSTMKGSRRASTK